MAIWVRKCASFEEERAADRAFWAQMSPNERVALVERLRQDWARISGQPSSDFEELLRFLNARDVRALVIGGHALAFHGHPRFTKDLDVFVEPNPDNATRLLQALNDFGFGSVGLVTEDFSVPGKVVQLGVSPNRIDLITAIDGVSFAEAWDTRVAGSFGAVPVFYLGRAAFIRNKQAAGRPQDLADIDALT